MHVAPSSATTAAASTAPRGTAQERLSTPTFTREASTATACDESPISVPEGGPTTACGRQLEHLSLVAADEEQRAVCGERDAARVRLSRCDVIAHATRRHAVTRSNERSRGDKMDRHTSAQMSITVVRGDETRQVRLNRENRAVVSVGDEHDAERTTRDVVR